MPYDAMSPGVGSGGSYGSLFSQLQGRQGLPGNMDYLMRLMQMMPQGMGQQGQGNYAPQYPNEFMDAMKQRRMQMMGLDARGLQMTGTINAAKQAQMGLPSTLTAGGPNTGYMDTRNLNYLLNMMFGAGGGR